MRRLLPCVLIFSACAGCVRWSPPAMVATTGGSCRSDSVRWISPDDPQERARLDAWCKSVGDAVIRPAPAGPQSPALADLVFVSWNVHVGNGDIWAFVNDLRAGAHTGNRRIQHFVLLLQEAVRTVGVPPLADGAAGAAHIPARARRARSISSRSAMNSASR